MTTYRVDMAYDGTSFHGYAAQPNVRTVQGVFEEAMFHHTGPVETVVAGRTDKGVHATAQVVSFDVDAELDARRLVRSINRQLAPEVSVASIRPAPDGFNARFSATGRAYTYRILNRETPDPFLAAVTWHYEVPLDVGAMNATAEHFLGTRDFASLCRKAPGRTTFRNVRGAAWRADGDHLLSFDVSASSFCHQMVRSMVALCVDVGRGRVALDDVAGILDAKDRKVARGVAPPHGLTLIRVEFGDVMEAADHPV